MLRELGILVIFWKSVYLKLFIVMSENVKFIVTKINKLLGRNYNLIGFNALSADDLLQVCNRYTCIFVNDST